MYQIQSAYGLARAQEAVWKDHDVSQLTGMQLFSLFQRLYLTLTSNYLAEPISIDVASYEPMLSVDTRPASEIFSSWTDTTPLIESPITRYKAASAVFTDAFRAGYKVEKAIPGAHYTSSSNDSLRTEMQISRMGLDMRIFQRKCLITANGYFYKGEATTDMLYVPEAGKTLMTSRFNHVGILSFEAIGDIQTLPVNVESAIPQAAAGQLFNGINVALPDVDLTGKTLMLVCMGKLFLETDGRFYRVGNGRALIHPKAMYLHDHYAESWNRIDWKPLFGEWTQPNFIKVSIVESDACMKAMLSHAQTFWVIVDTPHITKVKLPVRSLPMPGVFVSYREPKCMLQAGSGYVMEYWKRHTEGEWTIDCSGVRPGQGVRGTIGRDSWKENLPMKNVPYCVYENIQAQLVDLVADEIPE